MAIHPMLAHAICTRLLPVIKKKKNETAKFAHIYWDNLFSIKL